MEGMAFPVDRDEGTIQVVKLDQTVGVHPLSNTEHLIQDIHGKASPQRVADDV